MNTPLTISDLIPGATYWIDWTNWKGLARYKGPDASGDYPPDTLAFVCIEDGLEGAFRIGDVKRLAQHQGSLTDQLIELHRVATELRLYDAADFIKGHIK